MSEELARKWYAALNRLTKWRSVFAGWQLGTRPLGDPECDAVRDHREVTILMRAELTTIKKKDSRNVEDYPQSVYRQIFSGDYWTHGRGVLCLGLLVLWGMARSYIP